MPLIWFSLLILKPNVICFCQSEEPVFMTVALFYHIMFLGGLCFDTVDRHIFQNLELSLQWSDLFCDLKK